MRLLVVAVQILISGAIGTEASWGELLKIFKTWNAKDTYYFPSLEVKMSETLSGKCLKIWHRLPNSTIQIPDNPSHLYASSFPVSQDVYSFWKSMSPPLQMRVEPYLCEAPYARKRPLWENPGCQLPFYMHRSAPRCQTKFLKWVCEKASMPFNVTNREHNFVLPEANHATAESPPQPFLITVRRAVVSMCGHITANCGLVRSTANCMATGYKVQAQLFESACPVSMIAQENIAENSTFKCSRGAPFSENVIHHKRVFVVAEVDDTYVYHIHLEIMPRIVYHLQFLKDNPDVKILYGCDIKKNPTLTRAGLEHGLQSLRPFMELVGLSMDRLIVHAHVSADEVYFPMEGACQDPVYNTFPILTMRKYFLDILNLHGEMQETRARPVMMLMKRSSNSKHTRNGHDSVRQWSDSFTLRILRQLRDAFPSYQVVLFSDRNETLMKCYSCQIREFSKTDVLIGVHGAGLSNMLYMRPNRAVVELAPYSNDGRCVLGGGPFSRIASVMAHNYMMHHPKPDEYKWIVKESVSEFNVNRFVEHIQSFLSSISKSPNNAM